MIEQDANNMAHSSGDVAVIGEGSPNAMPVSMKVVQSIFHELTGKVEEMSKSFSDTFRIEFVDLEQLNFKILQCCEQYDVRADNFSAKIFYINDTADTFTSFDKFRVFNSSSYSSVESVLLTYSILILLPKIRSPQNYTITIRLASKVAISNKMSKEAYPMPNWILRMGRANIAVVSIKYVDYSVARNILTTVDDWMKSVKKSPTSKTLVFIQKHSHFIPDVFKYILVLVGAFSVIRLIPWALEVGPTFEKFAYFTFLSFFGLFFLYQLGLKLGRVTEHAVDKWSALSYLKLTTGDKEEILKSENCNKKTLIRAGVNLIINIIVGVLTGTISSFLMR